MRAIKIDYNYNGKPTISKEEYYELKESIKDTFDPNKISVLNKSLTKQQAFDMLFNDDFIYTHLSYLNFFRITLP